MHSHIWHLWRTMAASKRVHPIFAGRVHREHTRLRRFGEIVLDLFIAALILLPVVSMPLYAGILGYFALNQTRNLTYRVQQMGLYDLVAATAAGHVVTLWQCFAAWYHIYTDTRRFWFIYTLVMSGAAVILFTLYIPNLVLAGASVALAGAFVWILAVWVFMAIDPFLSIGLAGLLAMVSISYGMTPGTRLITELGYIGVKGLGYMVAYGVAFLLIGNDGLPLTRIAWAFPLLLLYIGVHEIMYRILWRVLRQRTGYEHARLHNAALW
jgi:hypothetical protein